jgi:Mrp family chromosome partitioning ATPase
MFLVSLRMILGGAGPRWKLDGWPSRLNELRRAFTYVLIAAPAASANPHTVLLGKGADGVILVLESQVTRRETARAIKQSLAEASVQLLGAVLNNHTYAIPSKLYNML